MKYILLLLTLVSALFPFSQEMKKATLFNCEPIRNSILWMAKTEVSNFQYQEFLNYLEHNKPKEGVEDVYPDTTVWLGKFGNAKYAEYYFTHPAYRNYPVVGVSKKKAMAYCSWLTNRLNSYYQKDEKHPVLEVLVRLPTEHEWKMAARAGDPNAIFGWTGNTPRSSLKKFEGQIKGNYVRGKGDFMGVAGSINDGADVTAPVQSYWPNNFGLFNMSGNVSELLVDKTYAIGGNWRSYLPSLEIEASTEFLEKELVSSLVGFRYVIEVVRFKELNKNKEELSPKMIEELLLNLNDSILVSKIEVTNQLYSYFTRENNSRKPRDENWELFSDYSQHLVNNYSSHSYFSNYPVVNITYDDAVDFCQWLTAKYNKFNKKKYTSLIIQLPTKQQWENAARGTLKSAPYPWGGPYIRNSKGHFLANFHPVEERFEYFLNTTQSLIENRKGVYFSQKAIDGFEFTCPSNTFFPNDMGVYNMAGNVNEMVQEKLCKGGSWLSYSQKLLITEQEEYTGPSPFTGFRFIAIKR